MAATNTAVSSESVNLLFVRLVNKNCGGNGAYCCLGRVIAHKYNINTQPIRITWELLDFDRIINEKIKYPDRFSHFSLIFETLAEINARK